MDMILANATGQEEKYIDNDLDIEIGSGNTFEVSMPYSDWNGDFAFGKYVYEPGTEHGGIIKDIETSTLTERICVRGYTWRGYLTHRIIEPPAGEDYLTVSGELNSVIAEVIGNSLGSPFMVSAVDTGVSVSNYKFNRYINVDEGLRAMLATKGYRLNIRHSYVSADAWRVIIEAVPAQNYGQDIEFSQDSNLYFSTRDYRMGINHLICLGTGELNERIVIHLYADEDGNISDTQTITGNEEIVGTYVYTSATEEELLERGTLEFRSMLNYKSFSASVREVDEYTLEIGDKISGRDYVTGLAITKPIVQKLIKRVNNIPSISYKIEGENSV